MDNKQSMFFPKYDIDIENIRISFYFHGMDDSETEKERTVLHKHSEYIIYVSDKNTIYIQTKGRRFSLAPGEVLILPPNTEHIYSPENENICFSAGFTFEQNEHVCNEDVYTPLSDFFRSLYCLHLKKQTVITKTVQEINRLFTENSIVALLFRLKICFTLIIFNLYDNLAYISSVEPTKEDLSPETMKKYKNTHLRPFVIDSYMRTHFRENITLEQMAKALSLSTKQLSRIIKNTYGQTFRKRITFMRVEEAKKLLLDKNLTIAQIAFMVGFSTHTGFYKAFKQITGKKPGEWR